MRLKLGQKLGPYKITRFIARGGMGEIYEAFEKRLQRRVALKVISGKHEESDAFRESLIKEARALAKVNHSNVVSVYSIDSLDGIDFIAMEYIDGVPLDIITEKFAFDTYEIIDVCIQMLIGIKALHDRKIVHRDIKPSNILLTDQGVVKWADFGLAAVLDQVNQNTVSHLYGTPRYLSPEQLKGTASFPSDIWCLGLVFYELFAGEKLIDPQKQMTLLEIEEFVMSLNFEIPRHLKKVIHPEFQKILKQMLNREIGLRYHTVEEVISDFRDLEVKISKEKRPEIFSHLKRCLPNYEKGWEQVSKISRLNDYQKKRVMTMSLEFQPTNVQSDDTTLDLEGFDKFNYFSLESLDNAQHLMNRELYTQSRSSVLSSKDLNDGILIYPDSSSKNITIIDTNLRNERSDGIEFLKKLKSFYWVFVVVSAVILIMTPKKILIDKSMQILQVVMKGNPAFVENIKQKIVDRNIAAKNGQFYPTSKLWFQTGQRVMFQWSGIELNGEGVLEIATDDKIKSIIYREPVTGRAAAVVWNRTGRFYWRVRTFDYSKRTEVFSFEAHESDPPETLIPTQDARLVIGSKERFTEKRVQFFWRKKTDVDNYEIQVAKDRDFSNLLSSEVVKGSQNWSTTLTPGIYYWRVRVSAEKDSDSGWSQERKFDIVTEQF